MYSEEDVKEFLVNCYEGNLDEVNNALSKYPAIINERNWLGE